MINQARVTQTFLDYVQIDSETHFEREMTARLCARLGLGSVQDATALTWDGDTSVWTVPLYGGTVLNDVVVDTLPVVATTRSGAFAKPEAGQAGPVTPVELQVPADAVKVKVAQAVKVPIIGMGGIMNAEDALEFILAGATAVSVGTANFANPYATVEVAKGIEAYMRRYGVEDINDLIGAVR